MNFQTNGRKTSINRLLNSEETPAQSTNSQVTAGHDVPRALRKMLNWLTIWFWVKKIRLRLTERFQKSHARQAFC